MSEATDIQLRMFDAVRDGDLGAMRELLHPDYVYTGPDGVDQPGPDAGVAVAEKYKTAFPDLTFEVLASHDCGGGVAIVELIGRGTHQKALEELPATGRSMEGRLCNIVEVRDGKIYREREYFDNLHMLHQLGVVPQPA